MLNFHVLQGNIRRANVLTSSARRYAQVCNLSAVLHSKNDLRLEQQPLPNKPGPNEVLVETHSVGICGSDVHYWKHGKIGQYVLKKPMILGHEASGTVLEVGPGVEHLRPGDRITAEPGVPCRYCEYCKSGKYNLCKNIFFFATPPDNGTLTRQFKHAADFCYKLPDSMTFEEGALMEPLAVAMHACRRSDMACGDRVLVTGSGPVGLLCMLTARTFGAYKICITDICEGRLEFARENGADFALNVRNRSIEEVVETVMGSLGGPPNATIECSGSEYSINLAMKVTKSGGVIQLVGMGPTRVTSPLLDAAAREVDIRGVFRYKNCYPIGIEMVETKRIDMRPLVTHRFKLEEAVKAFEIAHSGEAVKVIIKCIKE